MNENLYHDTDSIKHYVESDAILTKQALNRMYGKEAGMKDYIVVHQDSSTRTGIIFKKNIDAVLEREFGVSIIVNGYPVCCEDKYKDVVAKLLK